MPERSILIADDDKSILDLLVKTLSGEDHRFFLASDGKEAVEIAESNPIDLAILDILMPEMDGLEALKRIKEINETTEVLMITAHGSLENLRQSMVEGGVYDYILKPFDITEVKLTVRRALEKRELVLKNNLAKEDLNRRILELEGDYEKKTLQLRQSQIKYKNIVENSNDIILMIQDGYLKFTNKKALEISGYSGEEILNTPFIEMVHPDDRAILEKGYGDGFRGEDISHLAPFRILGKHETLLWSENHSVSTSWNNRPATLKFITDITQWKMDQDAIRIKDFAIASSINAITFTDLEGNITYINASFLKMWGYDNDNEALGRSILTFLGGKNKGSELMQALRDEGGWVGEITGVRKDGSLFDLQTSANMVTGSDNKPICIMASFVDITRQKEIEEVMMRSEKLFSLGQLSAGLAHELRNPLAVISSCSQFCLENIKLDRRVTENFQMIYRNSLRASNIINELMVFARPSHFEWTEVDVNRLLKRMLHMAELEAPPFDATVVHRLKRRIPKIRADEQKLGQAFLNLIQNASQAIPRKGKIVLNTRFLAARNQVEVNITDEGPGIPEDYRQRIFDPFFTTKDMGTGLGLSICHSIITEHKGSISVESEVGHGTTFSVRLPVNQDGKALKEQ